jgi:hypothetical protein
VAKKLETDFEDAGDSPGLMLWRVTNAWQASIRAALRPFDLTHVQFVLLAALTWLDAETPITQRDLAEYARTDPIKFCSNSYSFILSNHSKCFCPCN